MKSILVSGFGGQGVLSLGLMLSYAAMKEGLNTSFLPSYGPEMRGGTANCSVVISDSEVASPVISRPDILIAFNRPSLARFLPDVAAGGAVFIDACMRDGDNDACKMIAVPADELCAGNRKGKNIVMLGAVLPYTGLPLWRAEEAVREVFKDKPEYIDANIACLYAGNEFAGRGYGS